MPTTHLDRRTFLAGLVASPLVAALAGCSSGASTAAPLPTLATAGSARAADDAVEQTAMRTLRGAARRSGRFYGCATTSIHLTDDPAFAKLVGSEAGCITPEYQLNWDNIEQNRGSFYFQPVDDLLAFAREHRQHLRGHLLLWDQSTPQWAKTAMLAKPGGDWSVVADYFGAVLGRYGSDIRPWETVNEFIDTQAGVDGLRTNTFYRAYGPGYIERALREAHAAAPRARLLINDYSMEYDNYVDEARRQQMLATATMLVKNGAPLHGIGIQAHLDLSKGPIATAAVAAFYAKLAALGLKITITELDVLEADKTQPVPVRDAAVAEHVASFLDVALREPAVDGIVTWGLSDKYSWLNPPGVTGLALNRGLPTDYLLAQKPMVSSVDVAFAGGTGDGSGLAT